MRLPCVMPSGDSTDKQKSSLRDGSAGWCLALSHRCGEATTSFEAACLAYITAGGPVRIQAAMASPGWEAALESKGTASSGQGLSGNGAALVAELLAAAAAAAAAASNAKPIGLSSKDDDTGFTDKSSEGPSSSTFFTKKCSASGSEEAAKAAKKHITGIIEGQFQ